VSGLSDLEAATRPRDAAEPVAAHEYNATQRAVLKLVEHQTVAVSIALLVLIGFFSLRNADAFATVSNFKNLALDASAILPIAAGVTFVMIAGGLDLSVGSVLVFSSVVSAKWMAGQPDTWTTVVVGLAIALGAGFAWGVVNGILIVRLGLSPLIVTLGTFSAAQGAAEVIASNNNIAAIPSKLVSTIGTSEVLGVSYLVWIAAFVTLVLGVVLAWTRFGVRTYCLGSNREAARRAGIKVGRHNMVLYTMSGTLAGLSGFLSLAQFGTTSLSGHVGTELQAITAVVLGGVSLSGGTGLMLGSVIGVFIPVVLNNGFTIVGLANEWQRVAVGVVLVWAVYLDRLRRLSRNLE
jgi:ribose transport system permease protein